MPIYESDNPQSLKELLIFIKLGLYRVIYRSLSSRKFAGVVASTFALFQTDVDGRALTFSLAALWIGYMLSVAYEDANKPQVPEQPITLNRNG